MSERTTNERTNERRTNEQTNFFLTDRPPNTLFRPTPPTVVSNPAHYVLISRHQLTVTPYIQICIFILYTTFPLPTSSTTTNATTAWGHWLTVSAPLNQSAAPASTPTQSSSLTAPNPSSTEAGPTKLVRSCSCWPAVVPSTYYVASTRVIVSAWAPERAVRVHAEDTVLRRCIEGPLTHALTHSKL